MRKAMLLTAMLAMVVAIVPMGAQANHCKDVFVLSGDGSQREPASNTRVGGVNVGSATCTARPNNPDAPPTNFFTPGASGAWAAVGLSNATGTPSGTIKIGSASAVTITGWEKNELRGRWESKVYTIGSASSITVTVTIDNPTPGRPATQSITYTKAA